MHPDATPAPGDRVDRDTVIAQVEQAVDRLSGLDALPVPEHVARFEATHAALTDALSSIDKV
ncbi:MAG TPA: hypothetical protein VJX10_05830 [Pseudonocardiaceae bacterium]|nr:hypothetical protein [Pseudonocardiaceae bacterium]